MRVDSPLPPILPETSSGRINSFSSSMESRVQSLGAELPVLAAASVATETAGNEPSRWRRPDQPREDREADQQKRPQDGEEGEPGPGGAVEDQASEEVGASEEQESPAHELDVTL
jgi:hypothetical protein